MERKTIFNSPDKWNSRFVTADGYNTHYIEAGEDNPERGSHVPRRRQRDRHGQLPLVPEHRSAGRSTFHVYAIDELGHGQTDPPRNLDDLGHVRVRADHVISFIEALDLAPVNLIGQSQGGLDRHLHHHQAAGPGEKADPGRQRQHRRDRASARRAKGGRSSRWTASRWRWTAAATSPTSRTCSSPAP